MSDVSSESFSFSVKITSSLTPKKKPRMLWMEWSVCTYFSVLATLTFLQQSLSSDSTTLFPNPRLVSESQPKHSCIRSDEGKAESRCGETSFQEGLCVPLISWSRSGCWSMRLSPMLGLPRCTHTHTIHHCCSGQSISLCNDKNVSPGSRAVICHSTDSDHSLPGFRPGKPFLACRVEFCRL